MGRTISAKDLEEWKSAGRVCLVREGRVFDVTDFVGMHPGGERHLVNNGGRDVTSLMTRPKPHRHSNNAYKLMEAYYVGELQNDVASNGVANPHTVNDDQPSELNGHVTNGTSSLEKDLVDYSKPVLWQVVNLGDKYYDWTHQPISRDTLRLFHYDLLEYFSTSSWYAVPISWIPFISIVCWLAVQQWQEVSIFSSVFGGAYAMPVTSRAFPLVFVAGVLFWTLLEYILHRFLFHMEPPTNSKLLIGLHFILHGQHHKVPFHPGRLVFPPVAASIFVVIYYYLLTAVLPVPIAYTLMAGTILGYICYDLTHYYLHHGSPAQGSYFQALKTYHVRHHYEIQDKGFGISSKLWDIMFNTLIPDVKVE